MAVGPQPCPWQQGTLAQPPLLESGMPVATAQRLGRTLGCLSHSLRPWRLCVPHVLARGSCSHLCWACLWTERRGRQRPRAPCVAPWPPQLREAGEPSLATSYLHTEEKVGQTCQALPAAPREQGCTRPRRSTTRHRESREHRWLAGPQRPPVSQWPSSAPFLQGLRGSEGPPAPGCVPC